MHLCENQKREGAVCRKSPLLVAMGIKGWCEEGSANGQPLVALLPCLTFSLLVQNQMSYFIIF
jgi:hypothetical protein